MCVHLVFYLFTYVVLLCSPTSYFWSLTFHDSVAWCDTFCIYGGLQIVLVVPIRVEFSYHVGLIWFYLLCLRILVLFCFVGGGWWLGFLLCRDFADCGRDFRWLFVCRG